MLIAKSNSSSLYVDKEIFNIFLKSIESKGLNDEVKSSTEIQFISEKN